jgi:hypothetical protein
VTVDDLLVDVDEAAEVREVEPDPMKAALVDIVESSATDLLKAVGVLRPIYFAAGLSLLEVPEVLEEEANVLLRDAWE